MRLWHVVCIVCEIDVIEHHLILRQTLVLILSRVLVDELLKDWDGHCRVVRIYWDHLC